MKQIKIERPAVPRRLPPRWMVSPHYWPEIELRDQQSGYQVTGSFPDSAGALTDSEAKAIMTKALSR